MSERVRPEGNHQIEPLVQWGLVEAYQRYQQMLTQQPDAGEGEEDVQVRAGRYLQAAMEQIPHTDTQAMLAWAMVFSRSDEEFSAMLGIDTIE